MLLHQSHHSMWANYTSVSVLNGPSLWTTSVLSRPTIDSAVALSWAREAGANP